MQANDIVQIISAVGFPIVACAAMFWFIVKVQKENREMLNTLRETIYNNTLALQSLKDSIANTDNAKHTS